MNMEIDSVNGDSTLNAHTQTMTMDISNANEITSLLPNNDGQQTWFPPAQDSWSVPFSTAGSDATFPSVLSGDGLEQWPVYTITSAQAPDAFAALTTADAAFMLPTTTGPQVERLESTVWADVEPRYRIESPTAPQPSASSSRSTKSSIADHVPDLQNGLTRDSQATKQLVQLFFSAIHKHWPILHAPTFKIEDVSHELLGSMLMLASWLQDSSDHVELAPLIFDAVTATLLVQLDLVTSLIDFG